MLAVPAAAFCVSVESEPSQAVSFIGVDGLRSVIVMTVEGGTYRTAHVAWR